MVAAAAAAVLVVAGLGTAIGLATGGGAETGGSAGPPVGTSSAASTEDRAGTTGTTGSVAAAGAFKPVAGTSQPAAPTSQAGGTTSGSGVSSAAHRASGGSVAGGSAATPKPAASSTARVLRPAPAASAMNGTWSGPMSQPNGNVTGWTLRVSVRPGGGTFQVVELRCSGTYTDRRHTARQVVGDVVMTQDVSGLCARGGTVWMSPSGDGRLRVRWQDVDAPANQATGVLTRA